MGSGAGVNGVTISLTDFYSACAMLILYTNIEYHVIHNGYRARDTTQFLPSRNSHSTLLDSYSDVALAHNMQFIPVLDSANLKNIFPFN